MIKNLLISVLGGLGLSSASLLDSDKQLDCEQIENCADLDVSGFPFSFVQENVEKIDDGKELVASHFNLAPAVANFVFWAFVTFVIFLILSWAFEKFSKIVFIVILAVIAASYFGLLQIF